MKLMHGMATFDLQKSSLKCSRRVQSKHRTRTSTRKAYPESDGIAGEDELYQYSDFAELLQVWSGTCLPLDSEYLAPSFFQHYLSLGY